MIASTVIITELNGLKRTLTLTGPSLPKRGTTWGSETRLKTKFVNGNPEAVQHVLGPSEMPTDFEGMWRTTQLVQAPAAFVDETGNRRLVTRASTLVDAFEGIARAGSRLRVVWSTDDGRSILREGRISTISFPFDRFDDVAWKCSFQWVSRGATTQKVVSFKNEQQEAGIATALRTLTDVLGTIAGAAIRSSDPTNELSASNASLGQLESLSRNFALQQLVRGQVGVAVGVGFGFGSSSGFGVGANTGFGLGIASSSRFGSNAGFMAGITASVQVAVVQVQSSIVATQAFGADSVEQAAEAAYVARQCGVLMNGTLDLLGQIPPELYSSVATPSAICTASGYVEQTSSAIAAAAQQALVLGRAARQKLSAAGKGNAQADRASANDAVATVRTKASDTFASISLGQYGTADRGAVIARANGFPSFRVAPGAGVLLVIPALTPTNARTGS